MTTRGDPEWWSEKYVEGDGLGVIHCNPNGWSHDRRMASISKEVGDSRSVLDLGCGTGLYGFMHSDYERYVGVDFCPEYIDLAKRTVNGAFHCMSVKDFIDQNTERFDAVVMCGVLSVEPAFESEDDVFDFIKKLLVNTAEKVIATMPWLGFQFFEDTEHTTASGLRKFSADRVVRMCHDRGVSVRLVAGHMPHEILGVFEDGAWDDAKIDKSTSAAIRKQLDALGVSR